MSGGTLGDRRKGEPLPLEDIADILQRVAPALDYAHEGGVIHRDLKPANILFDEDGNSFLADFGIARLAEASQTMTMIGTPAYMSPEQVESEVKIDGRSDIYPIDAMDTPDAKTPVPTEAPKEEPSPTTMTTAMSTATAGISLESEFVNPARAPTEIPTNDAYEEPAWDVAVTATTISQST